MKNIKIILAVAVVSLLSSCNDAIDIIQPGELSPTAAFQTVGDLQKGLIGTYGSMSVIPEISFSSIFTDEVRIGFANGGQGLIDGGYTQTLNTNSGDASSIWVGNYYLINNANRLLVGCTNVVNLINADTSLSPSQKQQSLTLVEATRAQAHLFRAWGHFRIMSYFSPNMTDPNALSGMIMDHVPTLHEQTPRATNAEMRTFIEADLKFASDRSSLVDKSYTFFGQSDNADQKYLSADFIAAFKARYYAYIGNYPQAATWAQKLLDGDSTNFINSYPLSPIVDYPNIWKDGGVIANEVIFKLAHIYGDSKIGATWASVDASITGSPFFTMAANLFDLLYPNKSTNDIRYQSFVGSTSDLADPESPSPKGKIVINKYAGSNGYALLNDEKIFRVSEMYFILAESKVASNDLTGAQLMLQSVVNARYKQNPPTITITSQVDGWQKILVERRKELCYEGHRYLDLKRLGTSDKANVGTDRDAKEGNYVVLPGDHRWTMPIPNDEKAANPQIIQNPGY